MLRNASITRCSALLHQDGEVQRKSDLPKFSCTAARESSAGPVSTVTLHCDTPRHTDMIIRHGTCLKFRAHAPTAGGDHMRFFHERIRIFFAIGFLGAVVAGMHLLSGRMSAGVDRAAIDKPA